MNCKNYKGISLLNSLYKILSNILNKLLLNRIKPYMYEIIGDYQAGLFMTGKSVNLGLDTRH